MKVKNEEQLRKRVRTYDTFAHLSWNLSKSANDVLLSTFAQMRYLNSRLDYAMLYPLVKILKIF